MADESRVVKTAAGGGDGPRAPIPGLAQDIDEMMRQLIRERDEARARVAWLERRLARKAPAPAEDVPSIDLDLFDVDPAYIQAIPADIARKYRVVPLCVSRVFAVAMADPSNQRAMDEITARTGFLVQPVAATGEALDDALDRYYGPAGSTGGSARRAAWRRLRLVWSRSRSENPQGDSDGDRPAA